MTTTPTVETGRRDSSLAHVALGCALFAIAAVALTYWLIAPAVILGTAAVITGVVARRREPSGSMARDVALVAITLGAVAVLFTPVALMQTGGAEDWGRDCAVNPQHDPNC